MPYGIVKANQALVKQDRGLDTELLKDKQAIKEVEAYTKALGNPNIVDNILVGGIEGSAALKHEMVEINALRTAGWNLDDPAHIQQIVTRFAQSFETGSPQNYVPFHLTALKAELEYVQAEVRKKGIDADLGMIAKTLYRLDKDEKILNETNIYPDKLQKTLDELDALGIIYPNDPIPEELKNALQI